MKFNKYERSVLLKVKRISSNLCIFLCNKHLPQNCKLLLFEEVCGKTCYNSDESYLQHGKKYTMVGIHLLITSEYPVRKH